MPVISGLALGIDGTAHRGCLDGGGVPVAVVASGPDVVYPRRHRSLHERVRAEGLVLSELPPGTEPYRWSFPARNRIMAGLARMTLVVEAADPSGSLITAEFAKDLGRCVAAVPGRITSSVARGTNNLLKDGATPISGTEDVLDELFGVGVRRVPEARPAHGPDDPVLQAALAAAETGDSVEAVAAAIGLPISADPRRAGPPGGRRLPRPARPRRLGADGPVTDPRRRLGAHGEELAARHLEARGFEVVERNFRTRYGELDIVARDARALVFCEVKTRIVRLATRDVLGPFASIGVRKQRQVRAMAREWLGQGRLDGAPAAGAPLRRDRRQLRRRRAGCSPSSTSRARSERAG